MHENSTPTKRPTVGAVDKSSGPVRSAERIASLDVLRGFAVLGILVMNIQSFAMVDAAYVNPRAYGDLNGANYWVWLLSHILADMKFMTIFSLLFGAGILLMTSRREAATGKSAALHYRRMGWLLLFGLMHAYLLWYGDILVTYAICGMIVYLFRRCRPRTLIVVGLVSITMGSAIPAIIGSTMPLWPADVLEEVEKAWQPGSEEIAKELQIYRGGWVGQMKERAIGAVAMQTYVLLSEFLWRAGGLMLVGMALLKLDVLSAKRTSRLYVLMIVGGVVIGIPLVLLGVRRNMALDWEVMDCIFVGSQYNYWGSLFICLAWVAAIMLLCRHGLLSSLMRRLAAAGRMAFTNYILETVICTTIFYGHGLGLYGKVERTGQIGIVLLVWLFILIVSPLWLKGFRFGPLEWLWRSLTYRKRQTFNVAGPD